MQFADLKKLENKGNSALKKLRKTKLDKGLPFMINSNDLPGKQCYLEYADGRIVLVSIMSVTDHDLTPIRELSLIEKEAVRRKFHLS